MDSCFEVGGEYVIDVIVISEETDNSDEGLAQDY